MFWSQTEWILVVCRSARLVRKNIVKLGSSRKFCNLKAILFHLIYSFTHLSAMCSWSSSTLLRVVFGRLGIEHLWGSGCGCLIWCLVKNGAPQLMGQEYTCPELQYKVPSVLVKVLTPSKQMENAMNIMKIWEKLQKKKKKGNQFIFQCLWQFFLRFEQETLHVLVALGTATYVTNHGHGYQVSSMVIHLISFVIY